MPVTRSQDFVHMARYGLPDGYAHFVPINDKFADALSNLERRQVPMALEQHHGRSQHYLVFGQWRAAQRERAEITPAPLFDQTGLAPGVPHLANFPLASLHRFGAAFFSGHLANLPFASLQGAA